MSRQNQTATHLWEQLFATMAKAEDATLVDAEYDGTEEEARSRIGFAEAGWSEEEIDYRLRVHKAQMSGAPVTSPGVYPHAEFMFAQLCDDIESAMDRLGLESHARIARGIEPRTGPLAAMTNVVMTNESIVTVGAFLFRFCGLVARAFTRTLFLAPEFWESPSYSEEGGQVYLRTSPDLLSYWLHIFVSFAVTGTHVMAPFKPANQSELLHFEQVARAMEIFSIAHEYGHHHLGHGRQIEEDPKKAEFEADQFALKISYEVEQKPLIMVNPYISSGAGGVIILRALEILRKTKQTVTGECLGPSETHPETGERLERFNTVALIDPQEFATLRGFRVASARLLKAVESELSDLLAALSPDDRKGLSRLTRR